MDKVIIETEINSLTKSIEKILSEISELSDKLQLSWARERSRMLGMDLSELVNIRSNLFSQLQKNHS